MVYPIETGNLTLTDRVFFEGAIPPQFITHYLSLATAFITTSKFEGRPNAVLEALAYGKVIFASDIPAHREIIQSASNGFIIADQDNQTVATDIAAVLNNTSVIESVSQEAKRSVSHLKWEESANRYLALV